MSKFGFWLVVAVVAFAFALGLLGTGRIAAAVTIIAVVLLALVAKYFVIPLADAVVNGHDPFGDHDGQSDT